MAKPHSLRERFCARFKVDENGCWLWTGHVATTGYASITVDHRPVGAHRVSWEMHRGPIPEGLSVLHRCDVRHCVNPGHLFLGTPKDNMLDMARKGRSVRGEAQHDAKLSARKIKAIRSAASRGVGQLALALKYGVTRRQINKIVNGKAWRHVEGA